MVFSSLVFLWLFLPLMVVGYYLVSKKYKNVFLLLGSFVFYAWGEPTYILLMLFSILVNWYIGILINRFETHKKILLFIDIIVNIGLLGYFKYFNFLIEILNYCFKLKMEHQAIALPIGISFFTFQIMSYVIDLYRGEYKAQKNIINLALYISFFPQLIAGPIVRYKDINGQLGCRVNTTENIAKGIRRFIYGLGKKVIIANTLAKYVDSIYGLEYTAITGTMAWGAAILYTLQIYYDFSGYSDMAIGLGKIFGFKFLENFNYPYLSRSIQEFWKRWHISLSTWFREYVYIPLGGNRRGKFKMYCNLIIVFFVTGLWHGASFNFILWGMYHGLFSIIERLGLKKNLEKHKITAHIYALLVVTFGWILFRAEDIMQAGVMVRRMVVPWKYVETSARLPELFGKRTIFVFVIAVFGCGLIQAFAKKINILNRMKYSVVELIYCTVIIILCISILASGTYNPFIYYRF